MPSSSHYRPSVGDLLHVWPGMRASAIEPRLAVALSGPVPFGSTTCVRVEYLSGLRVGGTDYLALTHVERAPDLGCPFHVRGLPLNTPPELRCTCTPNGDDHG